MEDMKPVAGALSAKWPEHVIEFAEMERVVARDGIEPSTLAFIKGALNH
jgi:hypothetical protein